MLSILFSPFLSPDLNLSTELASTNLVIKSMYSFFLGLVARLLIRFCSSRDMPIAS